MMRAGFTSGVAVWSALILGGASYGADVTVPAFKKGDTVCFIGDSITQSAGYVREIMLFYTTRFPEARFDFHNCGLSGDNASGVLDRFDKDIAVRKPTVATLMLGMNDVRRKAYGTNKTSEADRTTQQGYLDKYAVKMGQLAGKLEALGTRVIYITPSLYDQTGSQKTDNLLGVNDALGKCADIMRNVATLRHGAVVDIHGPMTRLNGELQAKNPNTSLLRDDRVHPEEFGHFVIAYLFLKAQGMTSCVSSVGINAKTGTVTRSERCTVSAPRAADGVVSFGLLAQSLPYPLSDDAKAALGVVPFVDELDREMLSVDGLADGRYEVVIDGDVVQEVSSDDLKRGVNLATSERTPQYKQALQVKDLSDQRYVMIKRRIREIVAIRQFTLKPAGVAWDDFAGAETVMKAKLAEAKDDDSKVAIQTFLDYNARQADVEKEVGAITDAMWKASVPRPRQYVIRRKGKTP